MTGLILSIDQGTSGTKAILFDKQGQPRAKGSVGLETLFPRPGFVEQDPEAIYSNVLNAVKDCLEAFGTTPEIEAIGISNQRETFVLWDENGQALGNAVVWQCKRSTEICEDLTGSSIDADIQTKTGLRLDPYFSGTKVMWLKENDPEVAKALEAGKLFFGTIDSWLVHKMTDGQAYVCDLTNACRTLFFNLHTLDWDQDLLEQMGLANLNLPKLVHSSQKVGETLLGGLLDKKVPITGLIGDSHAAAFGEGCHSAGSAKATLGTGSSILLNTGSTPVPASNGMVSTICWAAQGRVDYALEGIIVSCGATIQWLRDQLGLIKNAADTEGLANAVNDNGGVYIVPAFAGLGAPYWKMDARAIISGLTFGSTRNHIARAALESVAYQIKDVIDEMTSLSDMPLESLNVDGGLTKNELVIQSLADLLDCVVKTMEFEDISALGASYMAGLGCGVYHSLSELPNLDEGSRKFKSGPRAVELQQTHKTWKDLIHKTYL